MGSSTLSHNMTETVRLNKVTTRQTVQLIKATIQHGKPTTPRYDNTVPSDDRLWGADSYMRIWGAHITTTFGSFRHYYDSILLLLDNHNRSTLTQHWMTIRGIAMTTLDNYHESLTVTLVELHAVSMCRGVTESGSEYRISGRYDISRLSQSRIRYEMDRGSMLDMMNRPMIWYGYKYNNLVLSMVGYLGVHLEYLEVHYLETLLCTYSFVE